MKEVTIENLAYQLKRSKKYNKAQPIFFLGAGASVSGEIPLAGQIKDDILKNYAENPEIKKLGEKEKNYAKLMECLLPDERNDLLKGYIDNAKINVTHIYLAQLIKEGYADYVLTVNFDNLMLRALALYNIFPPTYDMAILNDLTTTTFPPQSVVYLHGQHHGLWQMNTAKEMEKVKAKILRIFDSIKNQRPWVFIGYSGIDPVFEHLEKLGRFDNGLYWVNYKNNEPDKKVQDFLNDSHNNTAYIKGYDADSFMIKLNQELGLPEPIVLDKPFSSLKILMDEINDVDDKDHFKGVKERLEIARKNIDKAINQYELFETEETSQKELEIDKLKQEIIALTLREDYDKEKIAQLESKVQVLGNKELNETLASLFYNWGNKIDEVAKTKTPKEQEEASYKAIEKYEKAVFFKSDYADAYNNWGNCLATLAGPIKNEMSEILLKDSITKYKLSLEKQPNYARAYYNWGMSLLDLATLTEGSTKENLLKEGIAKIKKAIEIEPDEPKYYNHYNNLGYTYLGMGNLLEAKAALEKASNLKVDELAQMNLGHVYLAEKDKAKALEYYKQSQQLFDDKEEFINGMKSDYEDANLAQYGIDKDKYFAMVAELENNQP